jgi:superfamily II DNA/RNA helicase
LPKNCAVYAALPRKRQTLLFSATFSEQIRLLAGSAQRPAEHRSQPAQRRRHHRQAMAGAGGQEAQGRPVLHLMRKQRWKQVLVFAKTRNGVDQLVERLQAEGVNADGIHGDRPRRPASARWTASRPVRCRCWWPPTSRARPGYRRPAAGGQPRPADRGRGLRAPHRRTGRAGNKGEAISLVCADEVQMLGDRDLTRQTLPRHEEPDFIPEHRVPMTDASGQVVKKPKKPKKPKENSAKRGLGRWMDSDEGGAAAPAVKAVRKVPSFNGGPRKRKP